MKEKNDHPSQDNSGRFPIDAFLRSLGYRIHSRSNNTKESKWEKKGIIFTQREILESLINNQDLKRIIKNEYITQI